MEEQKLEIGKLAPDFELEAFQDEEVKKIKLSSLRGKWVALVFYPADFTFVCPTELGELADKYSEFQENNVEIMSLSTDTVFVHKAWFDNSETIKKIKYPMLADPTGKVCRDYRVYIQEEGLALRGTFIIDPKGILKAFEVHDNSIGRNANELFRKIKAAQFVEEHGDKVCPASWEPGKEVLHPGLNLVGKI